MTGLSIKGYPTQEMACMLGNAEAPILWSSDVKNQLIGKDPDAGND